MKQGQIIWEALDKIYPGTMIGVPAHSLQFSQKEGEIKGYLAGYKISPDVNEGILFLSTPREMLELVIGPDTGLFWYKNVRRNTEFSGLPRFGQEPNGLEGRIVELKGWVPSIGVYNGGLIQHYSWPNLESLESLPQSDTLRRT